MTILIIEDELLAQAKLESMLLQMDSRNMVVGKVGSVKDTLQWLRIHPLPDVAFVDIQLSDDHSFEIFRQFPVRFPVVFTTAYDKYLLESFEFNSIDYLLKPVTEEKLQRSMDKLRNLERHFLEGNIHRMIEQVTLASRKPRLIAKKGTEFVALTLDEIAYFFTEHKIVFVKDFSGRQLIVDQNLAELETTLDKKFFFRVNRKFICNLRAIEKFRPDNGKIKLFVRPETTEEIYVSKETAPLFREWISGR
ncbi:MAG: response regulator transcription factor [Bacteroidia bacterium]|nr:response regulator transcription factor [Bacteroidia bacterium]